MQRDDFTVIQGSQRITEAELQDIAHKVWLSLVGRYGGHIAYAAVYDALKNATKP